LLEIEKLYKELIERFRKWAKSRSDILTAVVVGSRARVDHPADQWADLDIVIVTTDPEYYVSTSDWIREFGNPLLTFIEPTATGEEKERRVLYMDMLDVDFAIIPPERVKGLFQSTNQTIEFRADSQVLAEISDVLRRGVCVLIDKVGMTSQLRALVASTEKPPPPRPTQDEFLEVVNDFLYHAVFTVKHLQRGELWWTITCLDCYMQRLLLRMIEWHAQATHDWELDTWFGGRFLEEWAHPQAVEGLHETFSHYNIEDASRALLASINLFRWLATQTSTRLSYPYPTEADKNVTKWIKTSISEASNKKR
jgi:aminoglycoside 6-adenylyltransferase